MSLDDIFELEEPRPRRVWAVIAVVVPVGIFAGVAAWFIRAYVVPPVTIISDPMVLASSNASVAPEPAPPSRVVETTGAAPATETPVLTAPPPVIEMLAFAPMGIAMSAAAPRAPDVDVTALDLPNAALENSEPIAEPVPLPHRKPRPSTSAATNGAAVPVPRPRP